MYEFEIRNGVPRNFRPDMIYMNAKVMDYIQTELGGQTYSIRIRKK